MNKKKFITRTKILIFHHIHILLDDFSFFYLDIPFPFVKILIKFDASDDGFILLPVYLVMAQMFKMNHILPIKPTAITLIYIYISFSFLSLLSIAFPSFYF